MWEALYKMAFLEVFFWHIIYIQKTMFELFILVAEISFFRLEERRRWRETKWNIQSEAVGIFCLTDMNILNNYRKAKFQVFQVGIII